MRFALSSALFRQGRISRIQYLAGLGATLMPLLLAVFLQVGIVPYIRMLGLGGVASVAEVLLNVLQIAWIIVALIAQFQFTKARLRDIGKISDEKLNVAASAVLLAKFIPFVNLLVFGYLLFTPGTEMTIELRHDHKSAA